SDDVGVVELSHDAGFAEEVPPLFLGVSGFERLDGHTDLLLRRQLQSAAAHLSKLP
ncbi:hypothetical protein M9458_019444, partial [Cirrhinus mrigala]